jgi:hypothetical protein
MDVGKKTYVYTTMGLRSNAKRLWRRCTLPALAAQRFSSRHALERPLMIMNTLTNTPKHQESEVHERFVHASQHDVVFVCVVGVKSQVSVRHAALCTRSSVSLLTREST